MERLEKNFLWLSAANISGSLFSAVLVIYLARVLEAENFGYISYATAIVLYLFNFTDLGLSTYGIREVAKGRSRAAEYVSDIVSFRFLMAICIFLLFAVSSALFVQPVVLKLVMIGSGFMLFTASLATEWAFQGMEKMYMVFISFASTSLLQLVLSVIFVKGPGDILKVPAIAFIGPIPVILIFLRRLGFRFRAPRINFEKIKTYLPSAIVIWAISVFAQAYNGLDIAILGFFRPPAEIGCFTVARRIIGAATLILVIMANALLPRLSCTFDRDPGHFRLATAKFLKISAIFISIIFIALIFFGGRIISAAVGSGYMPAVAPLRIMTFALILVMFNIPYSTGLIAACFEKDVLKQTFACAALNVILNFVLMPKYGMIGASVSFLAAESLALAWILLVYRKKISLRIT